MFGYADSLKLTLPRFQDPAPGRCNFLHNILADPIDDTDSREKRGEGVKRNVLEQLYAGQFKAIEVSCVV